MSSCDNAKALRSITERDHGKWRFVHDPTNLSI